MSKTLSVEELLRPRYKVIAPWPQMREHLNIGDILQGERGYLTMESKETFADYPHLLRPLPWHEEREESQMPEYLKVINGAFRDDHGKIGKVRFYKRISVCIEFPDKNQSFRSIKDTIPTTKEEYEQYESTQTPKP